MKKEFPIVLVDTRHYRIIARENWGLTHEQMKGKHVHHRIPRSKGGTNDPSNLYVCSEWFHDNIWHSAEGGFTGYASLGAKKLHQDRDEFGRSKAAMKCLQKIHAKKDERGKSILAVENGKRMCDKIHKEKDENGKSIHAVQSGKASVANLTAEEKSRKSQKGGKARASCLTPDQHKHRMNEIRKPPKKLKVIAPNGKVDVYGSTRVFCDRFKISQQAISCWVLKRKNPSGVFSGFTFQYVD